MIRPGSRERSIRAALLLLGDFAVAWASLTAAVYIRRLVPLSFTRSLLPAGKLPLNFLTIFLFGITFLAALGLAGFYRRRIMLRARPIFVVALLIQLAMVAIGAVIFERPIPRTILLAVPLIEALLFRLWRALQQKLWPIRPRETILVGDAAEIASALAVLEAASDQRIRVIGYA
ncbi:MAG: hypothetical protein QOE82_2093, partial [Thermoanaerobaculia bacterium]|nr:hypothetical protein [Thermoanaerobaculia bacterium]